MGIADRTLEALGVVDTRTLRVLRPGIDYHSKIFVDFYPFNELFHDLLIPPIYVSSGKLEYSFEHRIATGRTLGGVICDDWSVVDQKVSATGIECIFDAWEIQQAEVAGIKLPLPIGMGSTALLSKQGLQTLANMIRTGVYDDVIKSVPKHGEAGGGRWSAYWKNRGIFLLDLFLAHYKTNATVFDDDGMPIISGNIVIETDYTIPADYHPSSDPAWVARFSPLAKTLLGAGSVGNVAGKIADVNSDYENQVAKRVFQDASGVVPQTYLYGKFMGMDFDISKPFQSTVNFQFDVMNCLRNIASPEEEEKNITQGNYRSYIPPTKMVNSLAGHEILV